MIDKKQASSYYQHFSIEERPTVDYFVGLFNRFIFQEQKILTNFLNPREQFILATIIGNQAQLKFFGGFPDAERKRALITDWNDQIQLADFEVALFEISYNHKFFNLKHGDIYGSLANLGLELDIFGDIIHDENNNWQFFYNSNNGEYIQNQITKIGRSSVKLIKQPISQVIKQVDESIIMTVLVSSLRLDNVVSSVTNKSRSQVKQLISEGFLKINWLESKDSNIIVKNNDVVSVRHFGRFQILQEIGETKRGKHRLEIRLWYSKKR